MRAHVVLLLASPAALLAACADPPCVADDACAATERCAAGVCVPLDAQAGTEGEGEGEGDVDADVDVDPSGEGEGEGDGEGEDRPEARCSLADGVISHDELPVVPGIPLHTLVAEPATGTVPVDIVGQDVAGVRTWDLSADLPGDTLLTLVASQVADHWFAPAVAEAFPDAAPLTDGVGTYVAPLDDETLAVFARSEAALEILAVASVDGGLYRTFITYDPPILVLALPLQVGSAFSSESTGSGTFLGNPFYVSADVYTSEVDAVGDVVTRAGTWPALRLRVAQDVFAGVRVTSEQVIFMTPCLGVIARADSAVGARARDFTDAARVLRLASPEDLP